MHLSQVFSLNVGIGSCVCDDISRCAQRYQISLWCWLERGRARLLSFTLLHLGDLGFHPSCIPNPVLSANAAFAFGYRPQDLPSQRSNLTISAVVQVCSFSFRRGSKAQYMKDMARACSSSCSQRRCSVSPLQFSLILLVWMLSRLVSPVQVPISFQVLISILETVHPPLPGARLGHRCRFSFVLRCCSCTLRFQQSVVSPVSEQLLVSSPVEPSQSACCWATRRPWPTPRLGSVVAFVPRSL